ncbi:histone-lysine N-methyltransferase NSD3 [Helianthus annuus]|nr:histone-lysine N-methyltransferase NSD3 [Helianthus annuus]XP_021998579.1 histone-lysine N-methyltransferase NSD3 [Helianthus annuus]
MEEGLTGKTSGSRVENRVEKETVNVQTRRKVNVGDLIWVKLSEASWWPAQIADENLVSSANKPSRKGLNSVILARLYGSYIYKYVDIYRSSAEFKSMLIKNNFSYYDILKKSLEQDLPRLSSSKSTKRQQSKSEAGWDVARHSPKWVTVPEMVQPLKRTKKSASNEYSTSALDPHCYIDLDKEDEEEVPEEPQHPPGRNGWKQTSLTLPKDDSIDSLAGELSQFNEIQSERILLKEKLSQEAIEREDFKILTTKTDHLT